MDMEVANFCAAKDTLIDQDVYTFAPTLFHTSYQKVEYIMESNALSKIECSGYTIDKPTSVYITTMHEKWMLARE